MLKGNTVIVNESLKEDYDFEVEDDDFGEDEEQNEEEEKKDNEEEEEIKDKTDEITISFDKLIKKMKKGMDHFYIVDWPDTDEFANKKRKFKGEFQGAVISAEK